MKSFDDWLKSNSGKYSAKQLFEAGQQSQQAEIDCLNVKLKGANDRALALINHKNNMVDKLQSEIDQLKAEKEELEKVEFKLAQIKSIIEKNPNLLESILIKKIEDLVRGEHE